MERSELYSSIYTGTLINLNEFKKVKELGRGAFGITYLYQKGNQKYAVKTIEGILSKNSMMEIEILKRLKKCFTRNVLCFNQIDIDKNKNSFIITEFIDGYTLGEYFKNICKKAKNLHEYKKSINNIFNQCLSGLKYIHSVEVFHRDIKPDNIMISKDGVAKLIDFGMASTPILKKDDGSGGSGGSDREYEVPILGGTPYYSPDHMDRVYNQSIPEAKVSDMYSLVKSFAGPHTGYSPFMILLALYKDEKYSNKVKEFSNLFVYVNNILLKGNHKPSYKMYIDIVEDKNIIVKKSIGGKEPDIVKLAKMLDSKDDTYESLFFK